MLTILIILLGCNITTILYDRIYAALTISESYPNAQIDWFLSGGIKDPARDTTSEAEKMHQAISQFNKNSTRAMNAWNYVYDTISQNTAENFIMADRYLKTNGSQYDRVYVVTSQFHYERAKQMQNLISPGTNLEWVLSPMEMSDSYYWEKIHIKNVEQDVEKAAKKYYYIM
jgi:uncharacterized SAM-binding protein YcdF (DUF218 family)